MVSAADSLRPEEQTVNKYTDFSSERVTDA
jgi:hypothetical protein